MTESSTTNPAAAGYCPHCGSGDAGPTPEAYETARQRAVLLQTRIDNARDWVRRNLDERQQAGLLGVLRSDDDHTYRDQVNAPLGERTIAALNERLTSDNAPKRTVKARVVFVGEEPVALTPAAAELLDALRSGELGCCVCGGGPVTYRNYRDQPFCWPCADCECGRPTGTTPHAKGCPARAFAARDPQSEARP